MAIILKQYQIKIKGTKNFERKRKQNILTFGNETISTQFSQQIIGKNISNNDNNKPQQQQ